MGAKLNLVHLTTDSARSKRFPRKIKGPVEITKQKKRKKKKEKSIKKEKKKKEKSIKKEKRKKEKITKEKEKNQSQFQVSSLHNISSSHSIASNSPTVMLHASI